MRVALVWSSSVSTTNDAEGSGHYALWELCIQDVKPRMSILMADEGKRSFLIDWELATMFGKSNHDGSSRPKTMPFIALELFHNKYWEGKIHRQYHHDLEGFLWIVPFACLRYEHSDLIERPPIHNLWNTGDYSSSRVSKRDFLAMLQRAPLQAPWAIRPYRWE